MRSKVVQAMQPDQVLHRDAPGLAAEANHRVANSLAMIAGLARTQADAIFEARQMEGKHVRLILQEFGGRIETIARLHRLLADVGENAVVDLGDYLREISEAVVTALSFPGDVELQFDTESGCRVTAQQALCTGLIVGELVTNAVKYAHPTGVSGVISVSCHMQADKRMFVKVSDDGVGLPEGLNPTRSNHPGLRMMCSLAEEHRADLFFSDSALGLSVVLQIPASSSGDNCAA